MATGAVGRPRRIIVMALYRHGHRCCGASSTDYSYGPICSLPQVLWGVLDGLFLVDVLILFNTGFTDDMNRVWLDRRIISREYLCGWFTFDVLGAVPFDRIAVAALDPASGFKHLYSYGL